MLPIPDGLRGAWLRGDGAELILVQDTPRGGRRRGEAAEEAPPADAPRGRRLRGAEEESAPTPPPDPAALLDTQGGLEVMDSEAQLEAKRSRKTAAE